MHETLIVLLFFIAFAALFDRLRLGTVLGFLIGGAAIGPSGLGVIEELDAVRHFAELGVVFLLFTLGLELKLERLKLFETRVYMLAITQLVVTAVVIAAMAHALGLPAERAVVMGGALALSSTAIVLQVLRDWGRTLTQLGRMAIAMLLVQDIAVGPLLVLVEVLSEGGDSIWAALGIAAIKAVLVLLVVVVIARYLLRPLFDFIATISASEVFTATTLVVVLGASFATESAGLSMALGAFVAGLMVADTEYRHQVAADIAPFRGLLLGFFFMTVGMTVDLGFALEHLDAILLVAIGLLLLKALLIAGLAIGLGFPVRQSLLLGGLLGQGSEFAFVLLGLAATTGLFIGSDVQLLTVAVAFSMAMTPIMAAFTRRYLNQIEGQAAASLKDLSAGTASQHNHVVVIGFGQVGMAVTRHLVGLHLPVLALDYDPKRVRASQARKLPIYFGNAARPEVLKAAHVGQAKLVIIAIYNQAMAERVISLIHTLYPKLRVIARSAEPSGVDSLRAVGANAVVVDGLTTALDIAQRAILLYEPDEVEQQAEEDAPATAAILAASEVDDETETEAESTPEPVSPTSVAVTVAAASDEPPPTQDMRAPERAPEEAGTTRFIKAANEDTVDDVVIGEKQEDPVPG
ncbi:MAG: monovalent cation:proton antiporter-2 (CPA2) family protein [Alphaproteobacteria bacterium]|nr:monovalent cation:proton antiporter-2 (CPA2) family protein [Alphaproteobacteria bacterium]